MDGPADFEPAEVLEPQLRQDAPQHGQVEVCSVVPPGERQEVEYSLQSRQVLQEIAAFLSTGDDAGDVLQKVAGVHLGGQLARPAGGALSTAG
jgi:hypothetical protein